MPLFVFIIILAALSVGAFAIYLDHRKEMGGAIDPKALEDALEDLHAALGASEADRARLTERVRNLEAIVTSETYDLLQRDAPPEVREQAAARLDAALLDEMLETPAEDEQAEEDARRTEEIARLARRLRGA